MSTCGFGRVVNEDCVVLGGWSMRTVWFWEGGQ